MTFDLAEIKAQDVVTLHVCCLAAAPSLTGCLLSGRPAVLTADGLLQVLLTQADFHLSGAVGTAVV